MTQGGAAAASVAAVKTISVPGWKTTQENQK
jgi:hypothetical protein